MTTLVLVVAIAIVIEALRDREPSRSATVGELAAARATTAARLRRYAEERTLRFAHYEQAWSRGTVRPRTLYLAGYDGRKASGQ